MNAQPPARLVVLVSGHGSNLQALLDACQSGAIPARIVAVFSNRPDAYGLERARQAGIPAIAVPKPRDLDRSEYDAALSGQVEACQPDWVILAGWMRILSNSFLERFPGRVVNLHPALPGAFPGTHAIQRAFEAFQQGAIQATGVMVHLVPDEGVDNGPVLGQEEVLILPEDTLETLEERIHACEHRLLVDVVRRLASSDRAV